MVVETITFINKEKAPLEVEVNVLSAKKRNNILSKYFDVNNMSEDTQDMTKFLKEGMNIMDFQLDLVEMGFGIDTDEITGEELDRIFSTHMEYMLGFGSKN